MGLAGLSIYEMLAENGSILVARTGELNTVISSPAAGTTYYVPSAIGTSQDWVRAQEWGDKSFLVQSDQPVLVEVLDSEDAGASFQVVQGATVARASFTVGTWNSIETDVGLGLVQLRVTTLLAPTKITAVLRFQKEE